MCVLRARTQCEKLQSKIAEKSEYEARANERKDTDTQNRAENKREGAMNIALPPNDVPRGTTTQLRHRRAIMRKARHWDVLRSQVRSPARVQQGVGRKVSQGVRRDV